MANLENQPRTGFQIYPGEFDNLPIGEQPVLATVQRGNRIMRTDFRRKTGNLALAM
jgi:hypothetical protein